MGLVIGLGSRQIDLPGNEIVIGRSPSVQLSLPGDDRLADRHAVLRQVGARWLIEAEGDAAIRVGDGRPTKVAWLNPGDVIHLTESGPTMTFSPNGAPAPAPTSASVPTDGLTADQIVELLSDPEPLRLSKPIPMKPSPEKTESDLFNIPPELKKDFNPNDAAPPNVPTLTRQAVPATATTPPPVTSPIQDLIQDILTPSMTRTIVLGVVAGLVFTGLWTLMRPRYIVPPIVSPPIVSPPIVSPPIVSPPPNPAVSGAANVPPVDAPRPAEKPEQVEPEPAKSEQVKPAPAKSTSLSPEKLAAAVYLVLMSDEDRDQTFRQGTAWAVEKRRLVTTGSVALGLLEQREFMPNIVAKNGGKAPAVAITEILVHPEYRRATSAVLAAKKELDDLRTAIEESGETKPSKKTKAQMAAAQNHLLDALQEQLDCDLAILEVDRDLKDVLPVSAELAAIWPGTSIKLIGFPFSKDERLADPDAPLKSASISGLAQVKVADGDNVKHWLTRFRDAKPKDNWRGSPVLNAAGQVIGMYCQPSPPTEIRDEVPSTHEVTAISRLAEIQAAKRDP